MKSEGTNRVALAEIGSWSCRNYVRAGAVLPQVRSVIDMIVEAS